MVLVTPKIGDGGSHPKRAVPGEAWQRCTSCTVGFDATDKSCQRKLPKQYAGSSLSELPVQISSAELPDTRGWLTSPTRLHLI